MDHREEQQMEIDSLQAIFPEELTILTAENSDPEIPDVLVDSQDDRLQFALRISSSAAASEDSEQAVLETNWKFIFPPEYPEIAPEITLLDASDLPAESADEMISVANNAAQENIGMASVFSIVSAIQDHLNSHAEQCLKQLQEIAESSKRREEEEERRKMEGTRVSVESFIAWKAKFDAERKKLREKAGIVDPTGPKKLTGRQMFQENANLDSSDMQMMEEGDMAADEELDHREEAGEDFDRDLFEEELMDELENGDK